MVYDKLLLVYHCPSLGLETRLGGCVRLYHTNTTNGVSRRVVSRPTRHGSYITYDNVPVQKPHLGCIGLQSVSLCIAGTHVKHWVDQSGTRTTSSEVLGNQSSTILISLYTRSGRLSQVAYTGDTYCLALTNRAHYVATTSFAHNDFTLSGRSCFS